MILSPRGKRPPGEDGETPAELLSAGVFLPGETPGKNSPVFSRKNIKIFLYIY